MISNQIIKQTTVLWVLIALLLIPTYSGARVVSVQMSAPTIAFGGYSLPGVGQYEKITGVAYAEVDPADRQERDHRRYRACANAGRSPGSRQDSRREGRVLTKLLYSQAANLNQVDRSLNGYGKVMYEPPNRGGKTWTALGRVSGGGDDPATITDPTILANSFLMPRGYTIVWSGWEPLVPLADLGTTLDASVAFRSPKIQTAPTITGPAYEYIVVATSATTRPLSAIRPANTTDKTTP